MKRNFKSIDYKYHFALSQLFSPSLFKKILNPSYEQQVKTLIESCNLYPDSEEWDLVKGLDATYNYLKKSYRCEYIYKNEIANQLLLKYHSDNSATLLKEVNSNSCIADVVIVNGSTVAYEIKTELDNFDRLANQTKSYLSLYDYVNVVTHVKAVDTLASKLPKEIGIMILDEDGLLKNIRNAMSNVSAFSPSSAVLTLRQAELVRSYKKYEGVLPTMGTAYIHEYCINWYLGLKRNLSHKIFAESLKSRRPSSTQFEVMKQCSTTLTSLFLGIDFSKKNCELIKNKLRTFD